MKNTRLACLTLTAGMLVAVHAATATTISTNFSGEAIGGQPSVDFTNFGVTNLGNEPALFDNTANLGATAFVNSGPFYVGSNRAYGFAGPGRSDITFSPGVVTEVTLQVRGSDGQTSGPASQTIPGSTQFGESDVTVLIWSNVGVQSTTTDILNTGFQTLSLDVDSVPGDFISRISLINESADPNSIAFIGTLNITAVPEPTSALLMFGSVIGLVAARRRR